MTELRGRSVGVRAGARNTGGFSEWISRPLFRIIDMEGILCGHEIVILHFAGDYAVCHLASLVRALRQTVHSGFGRLFGAVHAVDIGTDGSG